MGASESFERYTNATIDQAVFMEMFGEVGRVTSITIGSRFERIIIMRPGEFGMNVPAVTKAFDFFNNIVPTLYYRELPRAWEMYQRACKQRSCETHVAFHHFMEGRRMKRLDRKGGVFEWVTPQANSR